MRGGENLADPPIETFHHAIGLRMFGFDQTMFNAFSLTYLIKKMLTARFAFAFSAKAVRKLLTIIRQHLGNDKRRLLDQPLQKPFGAASAFIGQDFQINSACRPADGDKQILAPGFISHLREILDVHMHKAGRVVLESFALGWLCFFVFCA